MATKSRADLLLELVEKHEAEPFVMAKDLRISVAVKQESGKFGYYWTEAVGFEDLLVGWMDQAHHSTVPRGAIKEVVATLSARARRSRSASLAWLRNKFATAGVEVAGQELMDEAKRQGLGLFATNQGILEMIDRQELDRVVRDKQVYLMRGADHPAPHPPRELSTAEKIAPAAAP